jgi:hypothetical protein
VAREPWIALAGNHDVTDEFLRARLEIPFAGAALEVDHVVLLPRCECGVAPVS